MIVRSIELKNFRNFSQKKIEFCDSVNVVFGLNGQGKTNVLEAISVVSLSKSFRTVTDTDLIQFDNEGYQITADFILNNGIEREVKVFYSKIIGKRITVDQAKIKSIVEFFGLFPVVVLSPDDDVITTGPPQERRRFLNIILSQLDKEYLKHLQDYDRILKQRNRILQEAKESRYKLAEKIEPWNKEFFEKAIEITKKRKEFIIKLQDIIRPIYQELTSFLEQIEIKYKPSFDLNWSEYSDFKNNIQKHMNEEILRGTTIIGPHRDEILFLMNGYELRSFGSRGQHRSLLLALKITAYKMLRERLGETPIFLLDDVYSEIDEVREKAFNDYFFDLGQVFITTHEKDIRFELADEFKKEIKYIHIENNCLSIDEEKMSG